MDGKMRLFAVFLIYEYGAIVTRIPLTVGQPYSGATSGGAHSYYILYPWVSYMIPSLTPFFTDGEENTLLECSCLLRD